jgi:hypothetical protein
LNPNKGKLLQLLPHLKNEDICFEENYTSKPAAASLFITTIGTLNYETLNYSSVPVNFSLHGLDPTLNKFPALPLRIYGI